MPDAWWIDDVQGQPRLITQINFRFYFVSLWRVRHLWENSPWVSFILSWDETFNKFLQPVAIYSIGSRQIASQQRINKQTWVINKLKVAQPAWSWVFLKNSFYISNRADDRLETAGNNPFTHNQHCIMFKLPYKVNGHAQKYRSITTTHFKRRMIGETVQRSTALKESSTNYSRMNIRTNKKTTKLLHHVARLLRIAAVSSRILCYSFATPTRVGFCKNEICAPTQRSPLEQQKKWSNTKQIRVGEAKLNEIEICSRLHSILFFFFHSKMFFFESMQMSFSDLTTTCDALSLNLFNRMLAGVKSPWEFWFIAVATVLVIWMVLIFPSEYFHRWKFAELPRLPFISARYRIKSSFGDQTFSILQKPLWLSGSRFHLYCSAFDILRNCQQQLVWLSSTAAYGGVLIFARRSTSDILQISNKLRL